MSFKMYSEGNSNLSRSKSATDLPKKKMEHRTNYYSFHSGRNFQGKLEKLKIEFINDLETLNKKSEFEANSFLIKRSKESLAELKDKYKNEGSLKAIFAYQNDTVVGIFLVDEDLKLLEPFVSDETPNLSMCLYEKLEELKEVEAQNSETKKVDNVDDGNSHLQNQPQQKMATISEEHPNSDEEFGFMFKMDY